MTAEQVYAMLKKRINSNGVSQEKIEKAVESYLERNPISNLDVRINGQSIVENGIADIPEYWANTANGIELLNTKTKKIQLRLVDPSKKRHIE